jgi:hypothetical protein
VSISRNSLIFIDFEGLIHEKPSLAGLWSDEQFRIVILDPRLKGILQSPLALLIPISFLHIDEFLKQTAMLVQTENKTLVAFSEYEKLVFLSNGRDVLGRYWNAHPSLKQWFKKHDSVNRPRPFTLDSVLRYFSYPKYADYGKKQATQRIIHVRNMLGTRGQTYRKLTNVAKSKCTKLIQSGLITPASETRSS